MATFTCKKCGMTFDLDFQCRSNPGLCEGCDPSDLERIGLMSIIMEKIHPGFRKKWEDKILEELDVKIAQLEKGLEEKE